MARWTASAKWGKAPALDGQCATLLGLALSEGLGFSALGKVESRTCMHRIVVLVPRDCKSSRGIPRLRPIPGALLGALRLAYLRRAGSALFLCLWADSTAEWGRASLVDVTKCGFFATFYSACFAIGATVLWLLSFLCSVGHSASCESENIFVALQFTPTGAFSAGELHGGVSEA